jgi:hypothetical protein
VKLQLFDTALVPTAFVAVTRHVYTLPAVSKATVIAECAPLAVRVVPPLLDVQVTLKNEMALPPVAPAVNVTTAEPAVWLTPVIVGALGAVAATNDVEALDATLLPKPLVASTVHV